MKHISSLLPKLEFELMKSMRLLEVVYTLHQQDPEKWVDKKDPLVFAVCIHHRQISTLYVSKPSELVKMAIKFQGLLKFDDDQLRSDFAWMQKKCPVYVYEGSSWDKRQLEDLQKKASVLKNSSVNKTDTGLTILNSELDADDFYNLCDQFKKQKEKSKKMKS